MNRLDVMDIKSKNVKAILNTLRMHEHLTKREIMDCTGLSFATISNTCNELRARGILHGSKSDELSVGRSPDIIRFDANRNLAICLDLQLQGVLRLAITNFKNRILLKVEQSHSATLTPREILVLAKRMLDESVSKLDLTDFKFVGVGVAVAGIFDTRKNALISCAIPTYEDSTFKQLAQDVFSLPVYVDNESNICAIAVGTAPQSVENAVYLDVSEGVGVGVITEGKLLRGKNGYGAEISHIPIGDPGRRCPVCGANGCVETELSMSGVLQEYFGGEYSEDLIGAWSQFQKDLRVESHRALAIARRSGDLLGKLAAVLINLFDPEAFFVGGMIVELRPQIEQPFYSAVRQRCGLAFERGLQIVFDPPENQTIYAGLSEAVYTHWNPLGQ